MTEYYLIVRVPVDNGVHALNTLSELKKQTNNLYVIRNSLFLIIVEFLAFCDVSYL